MSRKLVATAIGELGRQIGLDTTNVSAHKEYVRGWINDIRETIYELPHELKAAEYTTQVRLYASITAGTVTPSANGREVTGSSTTFTSDLLKPYNCWYIKIDGRYYQIDNATSDTVLQLRVPYAGTATASGQSYRAYRRYIPLEYWTNKIKILREHSQPLDLSQMSLQEKEYYYMEDGPGEIQDYPTGYTLWGSQDIPIETTYTVSADTFGTEVTAASGTTFLDDNLGPGDELWVGTTAYTVQKVTSQTTLNTVQKFSADASGVAATARQANRPYMELIPQPDKNDLITLWGYRKYSPVNSDNDYLEDGWWMAIRAGVIKLGFEYLKRPIAEKEQLFQQALQRLIREQVYHNKYKRIRPNLGGRYSGYF